MNGHLYAAERAEDVDSDVLEHDWAAICEYLPMPHVLIMIATDQTSHPRAAAVAYRVVDEDGGVVAIFTPAGLQLSSVVADPRPEAAEAEGGPVGRVVLVGKDGRRR